MVALELGADFPLLLDLLGELSALDRDGSEVRERRQHVEVFLGEAADVDRGVDLHGADHAIAVPQRHAHRRADAMDRDRLAAEQAGVLECVGGQQGYLLLGHHLEDVARDRDVLPLEALTELRQLRHRSSVLVEQDEEAAVHRQVLEDDVHDGVQNRVELLVLKEELRDLNQDRHDLLALRLRGSVLRRGLGGDVGDVEPELGVEVGDAADDRAARIVEE